jgi:hypothetical protein
MRAASATRRRAPEESTDELPLPEGSPVGGSEFLSGKSKVSRPCARMSTRDRVAESFLRFPLETQATGIYGDISIAPCRRGRVDSRVKVIGRCGNARGSLDQIEDVQDIGVDVMQFRLGILQPFDLRDGAIDESQSLLECLGERLGSHAPDSAPSIMRFLGTSLPNG